MFNDFEFIYLNKLIDMGVLFKLILLNVNIVINVVVNIVVYVIKCDFVIFIFLLKKLEVIEFNKGNVIIIKYII